MISKKSFPSLLTYLGFIAKDDVYSKKVRTHLLQINFKEETISYPKDLLVEGEFTTNFSSSENFVVFECVVRLLELGYEPSQLTLEPKWKLGHGASGGRADIVIKDNDENVFAIIECKTPGKEFNEAWELAVQYPSQLFSYAQQEGSTQLLCLYTSDFDSKNIERKYYIIPLIDNEEFLSVKEDETLATYKNAKRFDEKFNVWKNTYVNEAFSLGFFEEDIQPFHFGKKNYSVSDLKEISSNDIQKKYHQFATVLRKYNVSGRENAFDKLVNLFLCKVVDEQQNPANLAFYWKGISYDSDFLLQDRLQKLYQLGMKQFLNEDVTYIDQEQIDEAFRFLEKDNDPDATKETINKYFRQLKFFTNNDFAFIDVHNERLFLENAHVLRSIVEMLQEIKLKNDSEESNNQFLGDMFEGFLDAGVKQSEGQYFTPMPIVKFITSSLPLQKIINEADGPPKCIDYACGAGHFLTELARQIKPLIKKGLDVKEYYANITGIEKEYRLSKVAKVSAFMYGQDEINILHADALAKNEDLRNGSYNILVANPPYSVKGFLETLKHTDRRAYELFAGMDDKAIITNNSIETFFIERAKQLLAPEGVAAIVLPSSILSNDSHQYRHTREILLKYFHLIAIAEMGSGTFGKTGTNTVTLFLERRKADPDEATHYRYRAQCWINGEVSPRMEKNKKYNDLKLLENYCEHRKVLYADYKNFLTEEKPNEAFIQTEMWQVYDKAFNNQTSIKNYIKKPAFKKLNKDEQEDTLNQALYKYVRQAEEEKLYYYLLAQSNKSSVLVIKSPADNKTMKKFLGYEWSSAKGSEGIKYLNAASKPGDTEEGEPELVTAQLNAINTPLYNPSNKEDNSKINYHIIKNFLSNKIELHEDLSEFTKLTCLTDMLDFELSDFSKTFNSSGQTKKIEINSKWEKKALGTISKISKGTSITEAKTKEGNIKVIAGGISYAYLHNKSNRPANTITISASGANAGYVNFWKEKIFASDCTTINTEDEDFTYYLYSIIKSIQVQIFDLAHGVAQPHVYPKDIEIIKVPIPPSGIQKKIVVECQAIDKEIEKANGEVLSVQNTIDEKVAKVLSESRTLKIETFATLEYGKPLKENDRKPGEFPVMGSNGIIGMHNQYLIEGPSVIVGRKGSAGALIFIEENSYPIDTTFYIKNDKTESNIKFLFYLFQTLDLPELARGKGIGVPGLNRNNVHNLTVALPSLEVQNKIVAEIEILENKITSAKNIINTATQKKEAILQKYLN